MFAEEEKALEVLANGDLVDDLDPQLFKGVNEEVKRMLLQERMRKKMQVGPHTVAHHPPLSSASCFVVKF